MTEWRRTLILMDKDIATFIEIKGVDSIFLP